MRSFDALKSEIARRHPDLSGRLRQIAEFALSHPNDVALGTVSALAKKIGVQPSAMVRFANSLGYSGFTDMQQVFRARLVDAAASPSYRERIAALRGRVEHPGRSRPDQPASILERFIEDDIASLEELYRLTRQEDLDRAVEILAGARTVYVMAQGRSFTVGYYLDYALSRLDLPSRLFDGVGGLVRQRSRTVTPDDAVVLVSFRDYARETVEVGRDLAARGVPIIAVTDTALSPIAGLAEVVFEVGEGRHRLFRSLAAPLCLAQTLVVALGHRLAEPAAGEPSPGSDPVSP